MQPFIYLASATEDDQTSAVRNIPEGHNVETVSSDRQAPPQSPMAQRGSVTCTSTSEQEQNHGEQSSDIMVISKPALPATCATPQPDSTQPRKDAVIERKDAAIERKDAVIERKDAAIERKDAAIERKDAAITKKDAAIERKDKEINELEKRKRDLERYLLEKDDKIKQQKEKQSTSEKEQEKLKKARVIQSRKLLILRAMSTRKTGNYSKRKKTSMRHASSYENS